MKPVLLVLKSLKLIEADSPSLLMRRQECKTQVQPLGVLSATRGVQTNSSFETSLVLSDSKISKCDNKVQSENCYVDVNIDYEEYNEAVLELCKKYEYSWCEK